MVSASIDAISYLGLGRVFPANMTGNTVLLGIGLATGDPGAALRSATALGAFLSGAAVVGAAVPGKARRGAFRAVVTAEVAMMGALCGWWLALGVAAPAGGVRYGLIALAGLTMGAQSSLVHSLDIPVATTYITGTWTGLSAGLGPRLRRTTRAQQSSNPQPHAVQALVVGTYLATAYGAALAYTRIDATATALPLGFLLLVTAVASAPAPKKPGCGL